MIELNKIPISNRYFRAHLSDEAWQVLAVLLTLESDQKGYIKIIQLQFLLVISLPVGT